MNQYSLNSIAMYGKEKDTIAYIHLLDCSKDGLAPVSSWLAKVSRSKAGILDLRSSHCQDSQGLFSAAKKADQRSRDGGDSKPNHETGRRAAYSVPSAVF